MYFQQFYLACLAHASYLIGSNGEAAVIDPQRDIEQYVDAASANNMQIKYVFETHLHADFVSGHIELAKRTGAKIIFGNKAQVNFAHIAAADNQIFRLGSLELRVLETPGHTPESICIAVTDTQDPAIAPKLFSGDTLFAGDVGRPDLVAAKGFSADQMARLMYHSLHEKLLTLPDKTEIWAAHGAGSLCGKQLSTERSSTLGLQKKINYALQDMDEDTFVKLLIENQPEIPKYFSSDVQLNSQGPRILADMVKPSALSSEEVLRRKQNGALLLDVRSGEDFAAWHIPESLNIPLSGQFASWSGSLVPFGTPLVLIPQNENEVQEAVTRLARVGIESVTAYLEGGMDAWFDSDGEIRRFDFITTDQLNDEQLSGRNLLILDVRRTTEFEVAHVPNAINIPLVQLPARVSELPMDAEITVICASGYRSSIAASILERAGFKTIRNVAGGTNMWRQIGFAVESAERVPA